jgi:hypothetical protein
MDYLIAPPALAGAAVSRLERVQPQHVRMHWNHGKLRPVNNRRTIILPHPVFAIGAGAAYSRW